MLKLWRNLVNRRRIDSDLDDELASTAVQGSLREPRAGFGEPQPEPNTEPSTELEHEPRSENREA